MLTFKKKKGKMNWVYILPREIHVLQDDSPAKENIFRKKETKFWTVKVVLLHSEKPDIHFRLFSHSALHTCWWLQHTGTIKKNKKTITYYHKRSLLKSQTCTEVSAQTYLSWHVRFWIQEFPDRHQEHLNNFIMLKLLVEVWILSQELVCRANTVSRL